MSDFESYREEAEQLFASITGKIRAGSLTPQVGNDIESLASILEEIETNKVMWMPNESTLVKNYLETAVPRLEQIRSEYTAAQRRSELFGTPLSQENAFQSQREELIHGDALISELRRGASDAKTTGLAILDNLDEQGKKIERIDTKLTEIDREVDVGSGIIRRMNCRNTRRTVILWIVIIFAIIMIALLIYFIARK